MRIAFLGPSHPWRGGIAQFANTLGNKLALQGHDIVMFTFIHQYPTLLFPGSEQMDTSAQPIKLATQRVLTPYNPLNWFSAIKDIKYWKPDVIIVSYWLPFMAPAFGFILSRLKGIRIVYLLHNIEFHEKWPLADKLTAYALKPAKEYITLSNITTQALIRILKLKDSNRIIPLFHPVYEHLIIPHGTDAKPKHKMLFFGFVKHYKGLDILLQAMPLVLKKMPELKLVIAGDVYGDRGVYFDLIDKLGIKANVEANFKYIPDELLDEFFSGCDVCVLPYRTATQSGVAQMAFAHEVPVIATKVGGIEEVVIEGENGLLAPPEDAQALAEKIIEYYNRDYAEKFKANIRKQNLQFSWDSFVKQLLERLA
jgi:glycosyltransferase involved in cell wall biosynthesis